MSGARFDPRVLAFDPESGTVVREPDAGRAHYWAGCPSVYYDKDDAQFYLTYRRRHPRGVEPERGYQNTIARSTDGRHFEDLWTLRKEQLDSTSVERSCLRRAGDTWILYVSYVDPADSRWRIDAMTAAAPDAFDVAGRTAVLTAETTGTEGVKDPYVLRVGPAWLMLASYAASIPEDVPDRDRAHESADVYVTGMTTHPTGLASGLDGLAFAWQGEVLSVGCGWDRYQARLNCVQPMSTGFLGFYDGSSSAAENYEERCGLAMSFDLRSWLRLTHDGPILESPHASRSLRYVDTVTVDGAQFLYYEYARADGAHELRVAVFEAPA